MSLLVLEESVGKGRNSQVGTGRAEHIDLNGGEGRGLKPLRLLGFFSPHFKA